VKKKEDNFGFPNSLITLHSKAALFWCFIDTDDDKMYLGLQVKCSILFSKTLTSLGSSRHRSFATTVSQLKIWHFLVIGIERNVYRCTFNRYSVITQLAKLAAGEQTCGRCTHRKL